MGPKAKGLGRPGGDPPWTIFAEGSRTLVRRLIPPTRVHAIVEQPTGVIVEHIGPKASVRTRMAIDAAANASDAAEIDSLIVNIDTVGVPAVQGQGVEPAKAEPKP